MCRCCQNCWEDFYWNCFEEKFCYDESIAYYNPEEDEGYISGNKNGNILSQTRAGYNNNLLQVPQIIIDQPLGDVSSSDGLSNGKIHEEDYRRETQTNVPMLGPEILSVFANSQIFQDHQPTKLNRISTKSHFAGIHTPTTPRGNEQDRLIRRLEETQIGILLDSERSPPKAKVNLQQSTPEKRITFTLTSDSSPEGSQTITPKKFPVIAEEENISDAKDETDEVILRPHLIERHPHLFPVHHHNTHHSNSAKKPLRSTKSVPHFNMRSAASETDIFSISGSGQISMTPEVPSISFANLPKNYEDTPTIEKYRVSQSLYSIQTANAARATQDDYSMPRYFRRSAMLTQSTEMLSTVSSVSSPPSMKNINRPDKEKSKRLQMLRGNLPPLLIHSVSFRKTRDEGKQVD